MNEFVDIYSNLEKNLEAIAEENAKIVRSNDTVIELADNDSWYQIEVSSCDTHSKVTGWIYHLSSKSWVTTKHIHLFLCHVFSHFSTLAPVETSD